MTDISLLTAILIVAVFTAVIAYVVFLFTGWADRRDAARRNHAHRDTSRRR